MTLLSEVRRAGHDGACSHCPAPAVIMVAVRVRHPDEPQSITGIGFRCDEHMDHALELADRAYRADIKRQIQRGGPNRLWAALLTAWPKPVHLRPCKITGARS